LGQPNTFLAQELQAALREMKRAELAGSLQLTTQAERAIDDDMQFTHNDKFFFYQSGNELGCHIRPTPLCGNDRWDAFFDSPALKVTSQTPHYILLTQSAIQTPRRQRRRGPQGLYAAIDRAVPRWLATLGVAVEDIPPYAITPMWAAVLEGTMAHPQHDHCYDLEARLPLVHPLFHTKLD
jgi:hypothetical protein